MTNNADDNSKCLLVILDGWGLATDPDRSAISQAKTPTMDKLLATQLHATLVTYGEQVGLPAGQMGNSEVGHLNIGAGRIVYQDLAKINKEIADNNLKNNKALIAAITYAKKENKRFHLMGLLSDGGVHSQQDHLHALLDILVDNGVDDAHVHAFLDGRDTGPNTGLGYLRKLLDKLNTGPIKLATVIGRYYAMDRDTRWERIKRAYELLVHKKGTATTDVLGQIAAQYEQGITDEFMEPMHCAGVDGQIAAGDVVLFINYRTDRPRQLTQALTQQDFPDHGMTKLPLHFCTMTEYSDQFVGLHPLFTKDKIKNTLGEVIADAGLSQLRIAETEKYPHVSFFFSGGREAAFANENRVMVPSPKVATYDLQPEMSAPQVTDAVITAMQKSKPDFVCLNYANTDMVGHTGDFAAAVTACETVDTELARLLATAENLDYNVMIIADHGNSDIMINEDGTVHTAHTLNPVPVIFIGQEGATYVELKTGKLGDLAPTILQVMGVPVPEEMTGDMLLS